jgi:hypothetical protein
VFDAINHGSSVHDVEKFIAGRSPGETFRHALNRFYAAKRER